MNIPYVIRHCRKAASSFGAALALAICTASAFADGFAYQGVLKEMDGTVPADKNKVVEFRIYELATGGTALWGRACNVLLDDNGLFNTALSDTTGTAIGGVPATGLSAVLAEHASTTLYIGLTVDGSSGEISPRQTIMAVPYAMHAANAASSSGNFTVAGKVTAETLQATGDATLGAVSAASLTTSGKIKTETSGSFEGYGTIPKGGVILWSGSESKIPDGWALCNGSNGTPDLRDRFVVGAGNAYSVGANGGAATVTLTVDQMPPHTHDYKFRSYDLAADWKDQRNFYTVSKGSIDQAATTEATGGGQPHENRPPYYALCYIMRVK